MSAAGIHQTAGYLLPWPVGSESAWPCRVSHSPVTRMGLGARTAHAPSSVVEQAQACSRQVQFGAGVHMCASAVSRST